MSVDVSMFRVKDGGGVGEPKHTASDRKVAGMCRNREE